MLRILLAASAAAFLAVLPAWAGDAPAGSTDSGKKLFVGQGCYECHGYVGQGGAAGPALAPMKFNLLRFTAVLRNPPHDMPPYTVKVVTDQQATDIFAYLQGLPSPANPDTIPLLH